VSTIGYGYGSEWYLWRWLGYQRQGPTAGWSPQLVRRRHPSGRLIVRQRHPLDPFVILRRCLVVFRLRAE